jgi:hypothetical protein
LSVEEPATASLTATNVEGLNAAPIAALAMALARKAASRV